MRSRRSQFDFPTTTPLREMVFVFACVVVLLVQPLAGGASVDRYWEVSPYKVQVLTRFEVSAAWQQRLKTHLPRYVQHRAGVAYGPLWKLTLEPAADDLQAHSGSRLLEVPDEQLSAARRDFDKLILLVIKETRLGFEVAAQEYDCLLETWGPLRNGETRDGVVLPELAFDTLQLAFTPLATFRVIRETPSQVELKFRGANLPRPNSSDPMVAEGEVLRPSCVASTAMDNRSRTAFSRCPGPTSKLTQ